MKLEQALEIVKAGDLVLMGEYRGGHAENFPWEAKDGRKGVIPRIEHRFEFGAKSLSLTQMLPRDADATKVGLPASKGDKVLVFVEFEELRSEAKGTRGAVKPRVLKVEKIEANGSK